MLLLMADWGTADAAVVCARRRADGTFNSTLKVREACKPSEVQLAIFSANPWLVGVPPPTTTSTTGTTPTTGPVATTTTTSTIPGTPVCRNGIIEPGEACDCGSVPCHSDPNNAAGFNSGGCPSTADGRLQECGDDCQACHPAPECGDAHPEPGDTCDYAFGIQGDQCPSGSRCSLINPCRCYP
jgi:hypothetical protein